MFSLPGEFVQLLIAEFGVGYIERLLPAFRPEWLIWTIIAVVFSAILLWWAMRDETLSRETTRRFVVIGVVFGIVMMVLNALLAFQTNFSPVQTPRTAYPFQWGFAWVVTAVLVWVVGFIPRANLRKSVLLVLVSVVVGASVIVLFQWRDTFDQDNEIRQAVLQATKDAVPGFVEDVEPYLVLLTDPDYHETMVQALHARDANFAQHFALLFDRDKIHADVFYYDVTQPAPEVPAERAIAVPFIIVEDDGVYSPLRALLPTPYAPANPDNMVILFYELETQTVKVLDTVPEDLLTGANVVERVPITWTTNYDILIGN